MYMIILNRCRNSMVTVNLSHLQSRCINVTQPRGKTTMKRTLITPL